MDSVREQTKRILSFWIDVDQRNLERVRAGVREFLTPHKYKTNDVPQSHGTVIQGINYADRADLDRAISSLEAPLAWVSDQLFKSGDLSGAMRGALLHRHLFRRQLHDPLGHMNMELSDKLGMKEYVYEATDHMGAKIDAELAALTSPSPERPKSGAPAQPQS